MGRQAPVNLGAVVRLTDRQRRFVAEYLKFNNVTAAAVAAGYSARSARSLGSQLLDGRTYPLVAAEVRRQLDAQNKRALLDAGAVLRYIHTAILFCPADYCLPGDGGGGWRTTPDDYRRWPAEIKALVEAMDARADGSLRVKFVSKTAMIALAAKHQLGHEDNVVIHQIDWAGLVRGARTDEVDPIKERLKEIAALPVADPPHASPGV